MRLMIVNRSVKFLKKNHHSHKKIILFHRRNLTRKQNINSGSILQRRTKTVCTHTPHGPLSVTTYTRDRKVVGPICFTHFLSSYSISFSVSLVSYRWQAITGDHTFLKHLFPNFLLAPPTFPYFDQTFLPSSPEARTSPGSL
jgi:hypothetical protein